MKNKSIIQCDEADCFNNVFIGFDPFKEVFICEHSRLNNCIIINKKTVMENYDNILEHLERLQIDKKMDELLLSLTNEERSVLANKFNESDGTF